MGLYDLPRVTWLCLAVRSLPSCHFELYQDKYDLEIVPNLAAYQTHLESNYETRLLSPVLKTFTFVSSKSFKLQFYGKAKFMNHLKTGHQVAFKEKKTGGIFF